MTLSREIPLQPAQSALLFIDVQNMEVTARRQAPAEKDRWYLEQLDGTAIPNMQRLQAAFRRGGMEVLYCVIESLTRDGRDRSLDYKISDLHAAKGSWEAKVIDEIAPGEDEIVIPKSSSSVFISTNIDYVLRNLGVRQLCMAGLLTDQCVESAVRDACDLGYLVTLVTDACATYTPERHENSLRAIKGYCRQRTTAEVLSELG
ncbi:MAG: isochorismatase family cysteine hydrolase [Geminicoccaceae bacterium]